ncbi:MAG: AAA family ATPase [Bacillota bacterium]
MRVRDLPDSRARQTVSPDDLRETIFGANYQRRGEGVVWTRAKEQARRLLQAGEAVLIDATNVSRAARSPWVRMARNSGVNAYAIACWEPGQTPVEELLRRNAERARTVPEEKLREIAAAWVSPSITEGFQAVWPVVGMAGR